MSTDKSRSATVCAIMAALECNAQMGHTEHEMQLMSYRTLVILSIDSQPKSPVEHDANKSQVNHVALNW
jgi:hypothetical protein